MFRRQNLARPKHLFHTKSIQLNSKKRNLLLFVSVVLYTLPFYLLSLRCFLHNDDLMSLNIYVFQPFNNLVSGNFLFWNTTYRPLAGVLYTALFQLCGTDPLPYYITGFAIRVANLALLFFLLTRITRNPLLSAATTALAAIHWETSDAIYNFGAVFELLAFCFLLISFHLYLSFLESDRSRKQFYFASLITYILALNAKEIAITLPVIILVYEWIYKPGKGDLINRLLWLVPFAAIGIIYASGKFYSHNTYLEIPAFKYVLDAEVFSNLATYVEKVFYNRLNLNMAALVILLSGSLAAAVFLRNKAMLFGWFYFFITLIPVIGLRRSWGLYLYIPMAGIILYGIALIVELGKKIFKKPISSALLNAGLILLFAFLILVQYPTFKSATEKYFIDPGNAKRNFQHQLLQAYPRVSSSTAFAFKNAPLSGYNLHFLVWLSYKDPSLQVFRLPDQKKEFLQASRNVDSHVFEYKNTRLVELPR